MALSRRKQRAKARSTQHTSARVVERASARLVAQTAKLQSRCNQRAERVQNVLHHGVRDSARVISSGIVCRPSMIAKMQY